MRNEQKFQAAKRRMIRNLRHIIATHEQLQRDIAWWNANRLDARPFDAGGDLAVVALARRMLTLIESNQRVPDQLMQQLRSQVEANARA